MFLQETPMSTCFFIYPPPLFFFKRWLYIIYLLNHSINQLKELNDIRHFLCLQNDNEGSFDIKGCVTGMMNLTSEMNENRFLLHL